jgi:hypothetical protein
VVGNEVASVDQRVGTFDVRLYKNHQGGLKRGFRLPLNASLELIESLPSLGRGVLVTCSFREQSLRLVANSVREVPLPPKRREQARLVVTSRRDQPKMKTRVH